MRKPARLPADSLAPYEWAPPGGFTTQWGEGKPDQPAIEKQPINWAMLFGNTNPVEFEVGFGKGLFLITESVKRPDVNFFGVEIIRKYQRYASTRIARRALPNCKTSWGDAKKILRDFVSPGSLSVVHVFFPDPWWKSRHKKRTLFTTDFAELVWQAIKVGGHLNFATDVAEYFEMVVGVMTALPQYVEIDPPAATAVEHDMDYLTNFERKFRKEGRPIYRARWMKPHAITH